MRKVDLLSVVVPCHNEEDVLPQTQQVLTGQLSALVTEEQCMSYEIVYVNNGSTDQTQQVLADIYKNDTHVRIIELRRNFGYQGSISAGLAYAKGDAVVTIDADLQDPPEKIKEMLAFYKEGYDLVLGVRRDRSTDYFLKRVFSENYYKLLKFLGVDVVYNHGDFRLMARALVDEFNQLAERNRFIRAMILKLDDRYATITYDRLPRSKGETKFNWSALFSLSFDGIVSFSYAPLRLAFLLGFLACVASIIGIGWVIYIKVMSNVVPGWASTLLPIFAFSGLQLLVLGIIGEYIGRLYVEVKHRPLFSVRRELTH